MLRRGRKPSWMVCLVAEKAPEMSACEAITVAAVASTTRGKSAQSGVIMKNGLATAEASASTSAPWPK